MAHFGMLQEHKDMLRKNRLCLLERMNPEPVVQRLYRQNMMSQIVLESIQALPTRYEKNAALVNYLPKRGPKVFQLFCRASSISGQYPLRQKIQPEGVKWCVDLRTVITYDGKTLSLHKGTRSVPITLNQWNKLMQCIPEIQGNLEGSKNIKLHLEGDLYVITSDIQGLMYVGFHKFVGQEIIQGFNLTMDEWTEFLTVMESITEEVNESQPNTLHYTLHKLIHLSYIYILEREIIARAHYNCFGCEQGAPGQRDHMESGCLSVYEDLVHQYYPEAVMAFSRPLFAEVCR